MTRARTLLCALPVLAAIACSGSSSTSTDAAMGGGGGPIEKPCDYFTEEIASIVVTGPFKAGVPHVTSSVGICRRDAQSGGGSVLARITRGSTVNLVQDLCKGGPEITGLGKYACRIGSTANPSIVMLTSDESWELLMSGGPEDELKTALQALAAKVE